MLHGVGVFPRSFRAPVAQSSHSEIKPFCFAFRPVPGDPRLAYSHVYGAPGISAVQR